MKLSKFQGSSHLHISYHGLQTARNESGEGLVVPLLPGQPFICLLSLYTYFLYRKFQLFFLFSLCTLPLPCLTVFPTCFWVPPSLCAVSEGREVGGQGEGSGREEWQWGQATRFSHGDHQLGAGATPVPSPR